MSEIRLNNEKELINEILRGKAYEEFYNEYLQSKIEREQRAWKSWLIPCEQLAYCIRVYLPPASTSRVFLLN